MPYKITDLAYLAGLLDGEGCITIRRRFGGCNSYSGRFLISMTALDLLSSLRDQFGIGTITKASRKLDGHKQMYRWSVFSQQAASLLKEVLPYLHLKRKHAELVISLADAKGTIGKHLTKEQINKETILFQTIFKLNKRGEENAIQYL